MYGLTYRLATPKVVLRVYISGKVSLTGGKVRRRLGRRRSLAPWPPAAETAACVPTRVQSRDDVYEAFEKIYPVLSQFRKVEGAALTAPPPPLPGR